MKFNFFDSIFIVISILNTIITCSSADTGVGICNTTERVTKYETKKEEYIETRKVNYCMQKFLKGQPCPDKQVPRVRYIEVPVVHETVKQICCPGYEKISKKCVPVCNQMCENSKCTGPDNCLCNPGYTKFSTYRCVPECLNCVHGNCVAPGLCVCSGGYVEQNKTCIPRCEPNCNGNCIAPNVCITTTTQSTTTSETTSTTTENILMIETIPEDDIISVQISSDSESEEQESVNTSNNDLPVEIQDNQDTFYEDDNYEVQIVSETPVPTSSEWPCLKELVLDNNGSCRTQCEIDCHYGQIEDGVCVCSEGFRNAPNNPCLCEPYCEYDCLHGICVGNNTCLCEEGFKLNPENRFICLASFNGCHCKNGDCDGPDTCNCWSGYKLQYSEINYHRCEPICGDTDDTEGCVNGKCVAPFLCLCNDGFIHDVSNNYTCYPNLSCEECIENQIGCRPSCFQTITTSTERASEEAIVVQDNEETLLIEKKSVIPKSSKQLFLIYLVVIAVFVLILALVAMLLHKKYNKGIDYDIKKREQSPNNVYFSNVNGAQVQVQI